MESSLRKKIEIKIESLEGMKFQRFVEKLLRLKYGQEFDCVKQKRDKGCDGRLNDKKIIAVYAPGQNASLNQFKKKIKSDHEKYQENWQEDFPEWQLIYNGKLTANRHEVLDDLPGEDERISRPQILDMIFELSFSKRKKICDFLNIDDRYFEIDAFNGVISDMIATNIETDIDLDQQRPPYIEDKIRKNFEEDDVESIKREYQEMIPELSALKSVLSTCSDDDVRTLKLKVMGKCNDLNGSFDQKLPNLVDHFSQRRPKDDEYRKYVRVIVYYCFEACLIGTKVEVEE
jgi:hypothetical protein